ncbi:unnamed protein product [Caretta caretta]
MGSKGKGPQSSWSKSGQPGRERPCSAHSCWHSPAGGSSASGRCFGFRAFYPGPTPAPLPVLGGCCFQQLPSPARLLNADGSLPGTERRRKCQSRFQSFPGGLEKQDQGYCRRQPPRLKERSTY